MLSYLLAAQLLLPVPSEDTSRHILARMPAAPEDSVASARVSLWISVKGKVRDCRMIAFVGERDYAELLCRKIVGASFKPARDGAGNPVPSLFTTVIGASSGSVHRSGTMASWISGASAPADFIINLSVLPPDLACDPRVAVNLMINQDGSVAACEGGAAQISQEWVETACREVQTGAFEPMVAEGSERVAYLRNIVIKFETQN